MHSVIGTGRAMINGKACALSDAALAVNDEGVARGDGAFETIGVWEGRPFRLGDHLQRLERSLVAVGLPVPDAALLQQEAEALLDGVGSADAGLRLYVTASGTRLITLSEQPRRADVERLAPQPAPWIRPLGSYGPAGAKTMSYLPNMAATRAAQREGADDALLISLEGLVLEGPTFCVLWVRDGVLCAPSLDLGIVDSISRRTLLELAAAAEIKIAEGRWTLDNLAAASEFMLCSSIRALTAVRGIAALDFDRPTPVRDRLGAGLDALRRPR